MAEVSDDEKKLLAAFRELGVKPKAATGEELQGWLRDCATAAQGNAAPIKKEPSDASSALHHRMPRLSNFSGAVQPQSSEVPFDLWRHELCCLVAEKSHDDSTIMEAVRRSLRGEAARVAMRLGVHCSLQQLLVKFDSLYGVVTQDYDVLAEFYAVTA
jgi:hypothetical protein